MKYKVKERVELFSASYWQDWQVINENEEVKKSFMKEETAQDYCELLNKGIDDLNAVKELGMNRLKKLGLNKSQAEREFNRREWRFNK